MKKDDSTCSYGPPGVYSTPHLSMEDLLKTAGIKCTHIPYKGVSEVTNALIAGQIDVLVGSSGGALDGFFSDGKVRFLATMGAERPSAYPDTPTLKESGIDVVALAPFGLVGPAGMDPATVDKLVNAVQKAMTDKALVDLVNRNGAIVKYMDSKDYTD